MRNSGDSPRPPQDPQGSGEALRLARRAGLRHVCCAQPGIRRRRQGRHFVYLDPDNRRIDDPELLARIRSLAIPPAYREVWICPDPRGHLQAVGVDARGRRQYRYHGDWRRLRDASKFGRLLEFGAALPRLRRQLRRDLAAPALSRQKVLALLVTLLDRTRIRIGNDEYARENGSFGLTTLRKRHLQLVSQGRARLRFRGKGGLDRELEIDDRRLVRLLRRCQQLPGQRLFQYLDDDGQPHPIASSLVNDYLRAAMGGDFTAKDFRTWGATMRAIALLRATPPPAAASEAAFRRCINETITQVASELGNTPAVCRKAYIHPRVFEAWREGRLHHLGDARPAAALPSPRRAERLALQFLKTQRPAPRGR